MRTLLAITVLLVAASPAPAHHLHVAPKVAGDIIRVEAYYDDGTPGQEARVTLKLGDQLVAEGTTDDDGVWTCPRPKPGTYTVRAETFGHAAKETLEVPEADQS